MIASLPRRSAPGASMPSPVARAPSADRAHAYARAVVAREIVANRYVRLACERHLRDLELAAEQALRPAQPGDWRFNVDEASTTIDFFEELLRLEDGTDDGAPFILSPWQAFVVACVEGWQVLDEDRTWVRRFRNAYIETAKGSGKSPLAAGLGLRGLTRKGVAAPEIYSAGSQRDQSKILWTDADRMVLRSPALQQHVVRSAFALTAPALNGTFGYVSKEAGTLHGHRVYEALIDEEQQHEDSDVIDALRAGTKGQRNALVFRITNSGFDRTSVCWADHEYSVRILEGELVDDAWFAFVCGLDMCDEHRKAGRPEDGCKGCDQWTDEAVWPKANPSLGVTITMRYLREQVTEAIGKPSVASVVKRLNFCIWTEGSGKWLDAAAFVALGPRNPRPRDLGEVRIGYGGLDLASTRDLTALVLVSPRDVCDRPGHQARERTARCYDLRAHFWLPEANMPARVKRDHVPYDVWAREGWINLTPGDVTDYDAIRVFLGELRDDFTFRAIGHDKWNATQLVTDLVNDGFTMVPVDQGIATLNAPAKRLESDIAKGLVHHDGNPVMRWMVGNAIARQDAGGNIRPDRAASTEKIDGVAAWCDALHVMIAGAGDEPSGYETYRSMSV